MLSVRNGWWERKQARKREGRETVWDDMAEYKLSMYLKHKCSMPRNMNIKLVQNYMLE